MLSFSVNSIDTQDVRSSYSPIKNYLHWQLLANRATNSVSHLRNNLFECYKIFRMNFSIKINFDTYVNMLLLRIVMSTYSYL